MSREKHKKTPIVIPNAETLRPEELERLKHNERMRRYRQRKAGKPDVLATPKDMRRLSEEEFIDVVKSNRDLASHVLMKKLALTANDEEELKKTSLAQLATVFGILFDKNQLMKGLSTENISINAKIDVTMKADEALEELNKMRMSYEE